MSRGLLLTVAGAILVVLGAMPHAQGSAPCLAAGAAAGAGPPAASAPVEAGDPREGTSSPSAPPWAGLDLSRVSAGDGICTAAVDAGRAQLTLDVDLQRTATTLMTARHLPEAAVVLMDVATGHLLVYASHVERSSPRDLCAEATAPSASVFKIVTAAALVEDAHLGPETKQCYQGGEQHIAPIDLVENAQRDRWCTTLAGALGHSINTVFARLAKEHLAPEQLDAMARRFGYGQAVPFDAPVQPSAVHIPSDPLGFARTAAGFWNTTLSPLEAAQMSAIVARGGEGVRASVVDAVVSRSGAVLWSAPAYPAAGRVIARDTADKVASMMERTVSEGTSWRAFHDPHRAAFLPGIGVAGKTGTLTDSDGHRYYTWFTGFAPSKAIEGVGQVAVAVLVVNGPTWRIKANVLARDVLRAYFASKKVPGVTRPRVGAVARRSH
jgi:penicillin-binding protein A